MSEFSEQVEKLYALLDLKYSAVGIELVHDLEQYDKADVEEIKNPIN